MDKALAAEAACLHASLFHRAPDGLTIARYEAAHRELFPDAVSPAWLTRMVERGLDAEAIEFALRRRGRGAELTRKMQIVSYLAEARAPYLERFVNLEASRARAWSALLGAAAGAFWKLLKGEYAIRRHRLL